MTMARGSAGGEGRRRMGPLPGLELRPSLFSHVVPFF